MIEANKVLIHFSLKYKGDHDLIYKAIETKEKCDNENVLTTDENCITILDDNYPQNFKTKCFKPPFVLYYKGNVDLLKSEKILSVIVSRKESSSFRYVATDLLSDIKVPIVICGHKSPTAFITTLSNKIILVLPCGIDYKGLETSLVDTVVSNGGLVLTEYPKDTPPTTQNCGFRYRLVESLANKTLVLETTPNSGGIVRYNFALSYGNDIYAVPKDCSDKEWANNEMIYEGAIPCLYKQDLMK